MFSIDNDGKTIYNFGDKSNKIEIKCKELDKIDNDIMNNLSQSTTSGNIDNKETMK